MLLALGAIRFRWTVVSEKRPFCGRNRSLPRFYRVFTGFLPSCVRRSPIWTSKTILDPCGTAFYWVLPSFTGFYWVLLSFTGFYWVLLGFTGFYWVLLGSTGFYLILLGSTEFYLVLIGLTGLFVIGFPIGGPERGRGQRRAEGSVGRSENFQRPVDVSVLFLLLLRVLFGCCCCRTDVAWGVAGPRPADTRGSTAATTATTTSTTSAASGPLTKRKLPSPAVNGFNPVSFAFVCVCVCLC